MADHQHWHALTIDEVLAQLHTRRNGLEDDQLDRHRQRWGSNRLPPPSTDSSSKIFFRQFRSTLPGILLAAAAIAYYLHEWRDGTVIVGVVLLNAVIGWRQEFKAGQAIHELLQLSPARSHVMRHGQDHDMASDELVVGDIVLLQTGDRLPADGRWIESLNLRANEATLTGESAPVSKITDPLPPATPFAEQKNCGWRGTTIVAGHGALVVTSVGLATRFGAILSSLRTIDNSPTPLQRQLTGFSRQIAVITLVIGLLLFWMGMARGWPAGDVFLLSVSMIVSIIPEGLPVVITMAMAWGMQAMAKKQALVTRLSAIETLGSMTVLIADKTGTLTYGEMVAEKLWISGRTYQFSGHGYETKGQVFHERYPVQMSADPGLRLALQIGALNNDSRLAYDQAGNRAPIGDPTELALLVAAIKGGWDVMRLNETVPRVGEFPFDYRKKLMTTWHHDQAGDTWVTVKGAPQEVMALCQYIWEANGPRPLTAADRTVISTIYDQWAAQAHRGLAVAFSHWPRQQRTIREDEIGHELIFVGLFALNDAVRADAAAAVKLMKRAGIRTIMATGDARLTAEAIGRRIGILDEATTEVLADGAEIDQWSDAELLHRLHRLRITTRLTPDNKLRIARVLKQAGEVVGMTGDGINDVPALMEASVGIAVGRQCSDTAKEAADIILIDAHLANIGAAIAEGRRIFQNIRRVIGYLLAANGGELVLIAGAIISGLPLPLLPAQIIWLNAITDPLMGMALAREPIGPGLMITPPPNPRAPIVSARQWQRVVLNALTIGLVSLSLFVYLRTTARSTDSVYAVTLTGMALAAWLTAMNFRSAGQSLRHILTRNRSMLFNFMIVISMQITILYVPPLARMFHVTGLGWTDWLLVLTAAGPVIIIEEFRKLIMRRKSIPALIRQTI